MQRTYQFSDAAPTRAEGALRELLVREGRRHDFAAGSLIQQHGEKSDGFWLIERGMVSICRFAESGSIVVFAQLGAGDLFGELAHFAQVPRQVDAVAESDAVLVRVDARLVDRLLEHEPQFARWLLRSLANQLRSALDRIDGDQRLSAQDRLVRVLAEAVRREGRVLRLTQQGLADLVGVSRVTAGQILGAMARAGQIRLGYGRIEIIALPALADRL